MLPALHTASISCLGGPAFQGTFSFCPLLFLPLLCISCLPSLGLLSAVSFLSFISHLPLLLRQLLVGKYLLLIPEPFLCGWCDPGLRGAAWGLSPSPHFAENLTFADTPDPHCALGKVPLGCPMEEFLMALKAPKMSWLYEMGSHFQNL